MLIWTLNFIRAAILTLSTKRVWVEEWTRWNFKSLLVQLLVEILI